jgi:hypothetical protein
MRSAVPVGLCIAVLAGPAAAFHRQTPEVVPLTTSGDHELPRVSPPGKRALVLALDNGPDDVAIVGYFPGKLPPVETIIAAATGDNANPATSYRGKSYAWDTDDDPLNHGAPGRQVIVDVKKGQRFQPADDPTGTSANPALGKSGREVVFESEGDLTGDNPAGTLQVFLHDKSGNLSQLSLGEGEGRNAVIASRGDSVAFQSTSDPNSGEDTGIAQIWFKDRLAPTGERVTDGDGPSTNPAISNDGRIVAFESTADLAGDGTDTGIPQIFVWESRFGTFAKLTDDPGGCSGPSVNKAIGDWRVTYTCGGEAYHVLIEHEQFGRIDTGGDATRIVMGPGAHFVTLATTGDPAGGPPTADHQVYVVNLFKFQSTPVAGNVVWFPYDGLH